MAKGKKKGEGTDEGRKVVAVNKKARRDYLIQDALEAGIELEGCEVKSAREGSLNLKESYIKFRSGECFLVGCHISPYRFSRQDAYDPLRERKLLLHKHQIERLSASVQQKGLTAVPLRAYFTQRGRCKLEIALGKGKKSYDKREDIKSREAQREIERRMKG
jgi:SsrA-binding protein